MKNMIIERKTLPAFIGSYLNSEKIELFERNGSVVLSPVGNKYSILEKSYGLFSDGKLSSERFMREKKREQELER